MQRACLDCGRPTTGSRCKAHQAARERAHHRKDYDSPAYRRVRARVLAAHRARFGEWCPDAGGHATDSQNPLTVDHVTALAAGGSLLARDNLEVRCRSHNSSLGARR